MMRAFGDVMNRQHFTVKPELIISLMLLSLLLLGFSGRVSAEAADRDKPIDLEADTVKVDDSTLVIHADKLIVREDQAGFQHSTSLGNPTTFKQKMEGKNEYMEGSAQRIEYDGRMDKVQLYTKAWVKRGADIVHGDYIMYDANAEYAEVIGGGSQAATPGTPTGRVRAIIQPKGKKATDSNAAPTTPAKPAEPAPAKQGPSSSNEVAPPVKSMRFSRSLEVGTQPK